MSVKIHGFNTMTNKFMPIMFVLILQQDLFQKCKDVLVSSRLIIFISIYKECCGHNVERSTGVSHFHSFCACCWIGGLEAYVRVGSGELPPKCKEEKATGVVWRPHNCIRYQGIQLTTAFPSITSKKQQLHFLSVFFFFISFTLLEYVRVFFVILVSSIKWAMAKCQLMN